MSKEQEEIKNLKRKIVLQVTLVLGLTGIISYFCITTGLAILEVNQTKAILLFLTPTLCLAVFIIGAVSYMVRKAK